MAQISIRNVDKYFDQTQVLSDVSIDVADGEFVVIVGPSGCGKSTLLRIIAGLEDSNAGDILFDGASVNNVPAKARGAAMVFQSYALYPHMTVFDNMAFALKRARAGKKEIEQAVADAAEMLQLTELLGRYPKQLSGGQRQRVAIGRAIVRRPKVFLFDEPLSNLDAALRAQTRLELAELHNMIGGTSIYVTHDQIEAMTLADKIVVLKDGRVEQVGTPRDIYHRPATQFVAEFIGSPQMNFLQGELAHEAGGAMISLLGDNLSVRAPGVSERVPEGSVKVGIRPEKLMILAGDLGGGLQATISQVEHLGEFSLVYASTANGTMAVARDYSDQELEKGSKITLAFDVSDLHLFAANGNRVENRG